MKHDTLWGSTQKASVQQLRTGRPGQRVLISMIEGLLFQDIDDFLEGLDGRYTQQQHRISQDGWLRTMSRLFCFKLPTYRTR